MILFPQPKIIPQPFNFTHSFTPLIHRSFTDIQLTPPKKAKNDTSAYAQYCNIQTALIRATFTTEIWTHFLRFHKARKTLYGSIE